MNIYIVIFINEAGRPYSSEYYAHDLVSLVKMLESQRDDKIAQIICKLF